MASILIVDDDVPTCRMLALLVRSYGHDAECVMDPRKVLERVRAAIPPDLVILDVNMPGMSGIDVLRQLKAEPVTAAVPVVMFSAGEADAERDEALALGARDYWVKTGSGLNTLEARINACLRASRGCGT
jgi:CheY-like chemotaxis protein